MVKFIFEKKETPIVNQISTDNSRNDPQLPGNVKLPKIEIKKSSGDPTNWNAFIESFDAVIHSNPHLSNIDRMHYLVNHMIDCNRHRTKCLLVCCD